MKAGPPAVADDGDMLAIVGGVEEVPLNVKLNENSGVLT
jgi:hypothetical protein